MTKIKTVTDVFCSEFDKEVQALLDEGYELKSANCGIMACCDGSSSAIYQAILVKED